VWGEHTEGLAPTESTQANARTIDELSPQEIADAMAAAGVEAAQAVAHAATALAPLVQAGAEALGRGGRIIYVGAGTSGRLGVLDAAECPPTFGVDPTLVHGIIAGGMDALVRSIEGAEDDPAAGALAMDEASACADDLVIGIAASGNTPYVAGALERAAARGAATALITSNPAATTPAQFRVALDTGPEVVTGSTRLKAGTAAKIALNVISTGAMARAGFVYRGLMVGMKPVNHKLRERAARIVSEIAECPIDQATHSLEVTGYFITAAILHARDNVPLAEARRLAESAPNPCAAITDHHA
jgi:N-acetylmuramic acid 6-phosphate etherase